MNSHKERWLSQTWAILSDEAHEKNIPDIPSPPQHEAGDHRYNLTDIYDEFGEMQAYACEPYWVEEPEWHVEWDLPDYKLAFVPTLDTTADEPATATGRKLSTSSKDRFGVTEDSAPGIEELRKSLAGSHSALLEIFDGIIDYEAHRLVEAREILEIRDREIALHSLSNHRRAQGAAESSPADGEPSNAQASSSTPGTNPAATPEETSIPGNPPLVQTHQIGIHPEVTKVRINAFLVTAACILSTGNSSATQITVATEHAKSAYELACGAQDADMMARCQFYLGLAELRGGSAERALPLFRDAVEVALPCKEGLWAKNWIVECEKLINARGNVAQDTDAADDDVCCEGGDTSHADSDGKDSDGSSGPEPLPQVHRIKRRQKLNPKLQHRTPETLPKLKPSSSRGSSIASSPSSPSTPPSRMPEDHDSFLGDSPTSIFTSEHGSSGFNHVLSVLKKRQGDAGASDRSASSFGSSDIFVAVAREKNRVRETRETVDDGVWVEVEVEDETASMGSGFEVL